jgi:hypothetical protein
LSLIGATTESMHAPDVVPHCGLHDRSASLLRRRAVGPLIAIVSSTD